MGTSKQLITALEKSDWLDRLLIMAAVSFFFLVVLFILKQRLVDRGLRIALWWTRFLPSGDLDFDKMERGEGLISTASVAASSIISTALVGLTQTASTVVARTTRTVSADADPTSTVSTTLSSIVSLNTEPSRISDPVEPTNELHDEL